MYRKVFSILMTAAFLYGCAQASPKSVTEITIESTEFTYSPSSITIPVGQPVILTIHNQGDAEHDFVVENIDVADVVEQGNASAEHSMHDMNEMSGDYDLHVSTQKGGTSVLQFTALKPGTYRFFCTVDGHLEAGMAGELVVE
jgi:uncharacterized cupredoxin-like copper-binding protein